MATSHRSSQRESHGPAAAVWQQQLHACHLHVEDAHTTALDCIILLCMSYQHMQCAYLTCTCCMSLPCCIVLLCARLRSNEFPQSLRTVRTAHACSAHVSLCCWVAYRCKTIPGGWRRYHTMSYHCAGMCALSCWRVSLRSILASSSWRSNGCRQPRNAGRSCRWVGWADAL